MDLQLYISDAVGTCSVVNRCSKYDKIKFVFPTIPSPTNTHLISSPVFSSLLLHRFSEKKKIKIKNRKKFNQTEYRRSDIHFHVSPIHSFNQYPTCDQYPITKYVVFQQFWLFPDLLCTYVSFILMHMHITIHSWRSQYFWTIKREYSYTKVNTEHAAWKRKHMSKRDMKIMRKITF